VKHYPDVFGNVDVPSYVRRSAEKVGFKSVVFAPMFWEGRGIGAIWVGRNFAAPFTDKQIALLETFADQAAIAIQNARLFREIQEKSAQLEVASHHKSQFLASMSHELRTPLNAILGFNEMLLDQVYGELSEDVKAPLENMQASGKHLLRLINNVLDLAKIEAGRMELALSDYSVQDTVESVRSTLRPLAESKGLELLATVPQDLPLAYGDPGRITQCLMNLAGNSLKFTQAGKVEIAVALNDGTLVYRVADTGIGIPPARSGVCSPSSSKPTRRSRASTAARGSVSRSPRSSSRCTGAASGWRASQVRARPSPSKCRSGPGKGKRRERKDHPLHRGQRDEPANRARPLEAHQVPADRGARRRAGVAKALGGAPDLILMTSSCRRSRALGDAPPPRPVTANAPLHHLVALGRRPEGGRSHGVQPYSPRDLSPPEDT
jgi:hypothetical protein